MLLRRAAAPAITPLEELRELLHDAEEGLLGFDAVSPLKPFLGAGFAALTRRLEHAVFLRYGWLIHKHYSDQIARKAFTWSIVYLSLLFAALLVDHYFRF